MTNRRCLSQKSLITVPKWLLEGDNSLSRSDHPRRKSKSHLNIIVKRKRFYSKTRSIINWFYQFIKHIFIVNDESPFDDRATDDTTRSIMTYSTYQFERIQSILKSSQRNSKLMVSAATSSSNLAISPSIILRSSKSTQTEVNPSSSYQPTIASSRSNTISLQTTHNFGENQMVSKIHRPSFSLHDTRACHFDHRNYLIDYYYSSSTKTNTPGIVFAKSTCQLIKQAWL